MSWPDIVRGVQERIHDSAAQDRELAVLAQEALPKWVKLLAEEANFKRFSVARLRTGEYMLVAEYDYGEEVEWRPIGYLDRYYEGLPAWDWPWC